MLDGGCGWWVEDGGWLFVIDLVVYGGWSGFKGWCDWHWMLFVVEEMDVSFVVVRVGWSEARVGLGLGGRAYGRLQSWI